LSGESSTDIQQYITDVYEVVSEQAETSVSREEIEQEFNKFVEYGVPLPQAKQTLLKKYAGKTVPATSDERTLLSELQPNVSSVHILGRIISVNEKTITVKGEERTIYYGLLRDESTTVSFTAWSDLHLSKGDVVDIFNAYTREWQGAVQVNLGERTTIKQGSDDMLPEIDMQPQEVQVKDLRSGMGAVELVGRILEIKNREVTVEGTKKQVFSGVIGDATGKAQFTSWHDFSLQPNDVIKIKGGYVKTWKGVPQVTFDEKAQVKKLEQDALPKDQISSHSLPLYELVERGGSLDVQVTGTIIEIRQGSGVVVRCPECNRVLQDGTCSVHGSVKGVEDLRVKLVLDDGTGAVQCTLNRELTEKFFNRSLQEWKKLTPEALYDELYQQLFGHQLQIRGNALSDLYGTTLIAHEVTRADMAMDNLVEQLTHELGGLL